MTRQSGDMQTGAAVGNEASPASPPATRDGPIWISAAETSADLHGADLMRSMRHRDPDLVFLGIGGELMRGEGLESAGRAEELSAMGISEVLGLLPRVLALYRRIKRILLERPPRCLVLLDAPDFHFRVAKMASRLGIPVYYYISPQVWAWRKGRVAFIREHVRRMLCILPFEQAFYAGHNVQADFVGHPLVQYITPRQPSSEQPASARRIAVLPGSRKMEIRRLLPQFAAACRTLQQRFPDLEFHLIRAPGVEDEELTAHWPQEIPLSICPFRERYERIRSCSLALTTSGTASLECGLLTTPAIIAYKLSALSYAVAWLAVDVPWISLPNLVLEREVFPEFVQSRARADLLAEQAASWLRDPAELQRIRNELRTLRQELGQKHAAEESARIILGDMQSREEKGCGESAEGS
ncbi:MAG: lipid-A-disaccharide synthase [Desulfohalobiaceae bacterium]|nr:lipid-A-disaccharide synthase [Desulfohalobiaceae bacterium]